MSNVKTGHGKACELSPFQEQQIRYLRSLGNSEVQIASTLRLPYRQINRVIAATRSAASSDDGSDA